MKITRASQLGLQLTSAMVENIFAIHNKNYISLCSDEHLHNKAIRYFLEIFSDEFAKNSPVRSMIDEPVVCPKNRNYVITQPVIELSKRIKIDEGKFDVRFLRKIPNKKITLLLGGNCFIRFVKHGDDIFAIRGDTRPAADVPSQVYFTYTSFKIDLIEGSINYGNNKDASLDDPNFMFFLRLLIFIELSELEVITLKPSEKSGTRRHGKYINNSNSDLVVVNSSWNRILVRKEGFDVQPHFRLQACGKEWEDRKLVFIDAFKKEGYIRRARRDTIEDATH